MLKARYPFAPSDFLLAHRGRTTNSFRMTQKSIYWISAIVIVLLVAGGIFVFRNAAKPKSGAGSSTKTTAVVQPVFAPKGQLVDTFPKELIMGGNSVTQTSYKVSDANSNQSTAVYDTSDAVGTIYQGYLAYFSKNGYSLINKQISANGDSAQTFAIGATGSISVQISTAGSSTHVSATFQKQ